MISDHTAAELRTLPAGQRVGSILKAYDKANERRRVLEKCADLRGGIAADEIVIDLRAGFSEGMV